MTKCFFVINNCIRCTIGNAIILPQKGIFVITDTYSNKIYDDFLSLVVIVYVEHLMKSLYNLTV